MSMRCWITIPVLLGTIGAFGQDDTTRFKTQKTFLAGDATTDIASGDFDGDGRIDLAVVNRDAGTVQIIRNTGNDDLGTRLFLPQAPINVGLRPNALVAADFDGDDDLDLAVALLGDDQVAILRNNGNGTFATPLKFDVGDTPTDIAVGDIVPGNGLDIATANEMANSVSILINDGNGVFTAAPDVPMGTNVPRPKAVAIADLDGDGIADVIVTQFARDRVAYRFGNGDGTFGEDLNLVETGSDPWNLAVADLNGDGANDIAVANATSDNVTVLLNDGSGGFSGVNFAAGNRPEGITIGDANGDDRPDIITANREGDNLSVLVGDGDGGFAPPKNFKTDGAPTAVALADLNEDGALDLATSNQEDDNVSILISGDDPALDDFLMMDCGAGCGPMGMLPLLFTFMGIAGMKRRIRRH